jgi:hypothetical protein
MRRLTVIAVITTLSVLGGAGMAMAADDNSSVDQYLEDVPSAAGDGGGEGGQGEDSNEGSASLPQEVSDEFEEAGSDGAAAAELAEATAPAGGGDAAGAPTGSGSAADRAEGHAEETAAGQPDAAAPSSAVDESGDDSGGMSVVLPILLGLTVLAAAAYLLMRNRAPDVDAAR